MNKTFTINQCITFNITDNTLIHPPSGQRLTLRAPAALCLKLLLENPGKIVAHRELCQYAWERFGIAVTNNTLHGVIYALRKAFSELGECGEEIIKTVPRRGFLLPETVQVTMHSVPIEAEAAAIPPPSFVDVPPLPGPQHIPFTPRLVAVACLTLVASVVVNYAVLVSLLSVDSYASQHFLPSATRALASVEHAFSREPGSQCPRQRALQQQRALLRPLAPVELAALTRPERLTDEPLDAGIIPAQPQELHYED
ncbi:winged helix-turn-helix domain-containing protein [Pantoea sp. 1.19]|uniref:winged helix-turn-helix domain-containing protein n=1 Tax=Pantoea sp. 1.19 TaxID=1925589 RepID=UPI0009488D0C|nr:winged helix-turn-helix domain-containing protein [Pantoea sp. 1.19]